MTNLDLKVLNNLIKYLSKIDYDDNIEFFNENIDINKVNEYIRYIILRKLSEEDIETLNKRITKIHTYDMDFIGVYSKDNNTNIKVILPKLTNLKSALIYIHELTHYVYYLFREGIYTYDNIFDEVIPFSNEGYFLREFYGNDYLNKLDFQIRNNVIKCAHILDEDKSQLMNKLAHIYSYYLCKNFSFFKDDKDFLNDLNESDKNLGKELRNKGLILTNGILLNLN